MSYGEDQLQLLVNEAEGVWDHCDDLHGDRCELHHVLHLHYFQYVAPCEDQNEAHHEYVDHHGALHEGLHVGLHEDLREVHHEGHHVVLNEVLHVAQNEGLSEEALNVGQNDVGRDVEHERDEVHGVEPVQGDVLDDTESEEGLCVGEALLEVAVEVHWDDEVVALGGEQ